MCLFPWLVVSVGFIGCLFFHCFFSDFIMFIFRIFFLSSVFSLLSFPSIFPPFPQFSFYFFSVSPFLIFLRCLSFNSLFFHLYLYLLLTCYLFPIAFPLFSSTSLFISPSLVYIFLFPFHLFLLLFPLPTSISLLPSFIQGLCTHITPASASLPLFPVHPPKVVLVRVSSLGVLLGGHHRGEFFSSQSLALWEEVLEEAFVWGGEGIVLALGEVLRRRLKGSYYWGHWRGPGIVAAGDDREESPDCEEHGVGSGKSERNCRQELGRFIFLFFVHV